MSAFSLIEVTLALGVMAFAFLPVLGLLPTGLNAFHQAMDATVGSQIAQRVINEAQQTDYDQLITDATGMTITGANNTGCKAVRYFDNQGGEVTSPTTAIYQVNTRILPATVVPFGAGASVPAEASDNNLATVTVQVATNPSGGAMASNSNLWTGAYQSTPNNINVVPMTTYSALISRNK